MRVTLSAAQVREACEAFVERRTFIPDTGGTYSAGYGGDSVVVVINARRVRKPKQKEATQ